MPVDDVTVEEPDAETEPEATEPEATVEVVDAEGVELTAEDEDETVRSSALAIREEREAAQPPAHVLPTVREFEAAMAIAERMANSRSFVPVAYQGRPDDVLAAILAGRELGIGPMQALRDIVMIDGRATLSAHLMLARLRVGGVQILESVTTTERAWIKAKRRDTGEVAEVEWTFAEATQVMQRGKRLTEKDNWRNYPADMLWARAVGRLARRLGPDLVGGMQYTKEEVEDFDDGGDYGSLAYASSVPTTPLGKPVAERRHDAPNTWETIIASLQDSVPLDWPRVISMIVAGYYGEPYDSVASLPEGERLHAGVRVANLAASLREGPDFPPPSDEEIAKMIAAAFEGTAIPLPLPGKPKDQTETPPEISEHDAAIPFGDEATS